MPRFVVLEHRSAQGVHWDFMLEHGPALATWQLSLPPDATGPIPASRLADHRLAYLDYEGPVSGERGEVKRWDRGEYQIEQIGQHEWVFRLSGAKLSGRFALIRQEEPNSWQLTKAGQ